MKKYQLYAMGNALVDVVVQVQDAFLQENKIKKGVMTLTDLDSQIKLLDHFPLNKRLQRSGGSAANTAVAFAQMGGKCFYACTVSDDDLGHFYLQDLKKASIQSASHYSVQTSGATGTCLVMVSPDGERSMHTYLGISEAFSQAQLDEKALSDSEWLYMEGYLLTSANGFEALQHAQRLAQKSDTKVALTLSDPFVVQQYRARLEHLVRTGIDLLFCNEEEARIFTKEAKTEAFLPILEALVPNYVVTQGSKGALCYDGHNLSQARAKNVNAIDTNGAGDMFAGAFLYAILHQKPTKVAASIACRAATAVVQQLGPRLNKEQLNALNL